LGNERKEAIALLRTPEVDAVLVAEGLAHCRRAVDRYGALDDTSWLDRPLASFLSSADRIQLRQDMGDLLVLWAQALTRRATTRKGQDRAEDLGAAAKRLELAESCFSAGAFPRTLLLTRANLERLKWDRTDRERELRNLAQKIPLLTDPGRLPIEDPDEIDPDLLRRMSAGTEALTERDSQNWAVWVALGNWNFRLHRFAEAKTAFSVAVALAPRSPWTRYVRALLYLELKDYSLALADLENVIASQPELAAAYLNRALAKLGLGDAKGALGRAQK
jgi:tetratricopeptide (TPR) repeat protein